MSAKRVWRTPMAFARAPTDLTTSNVTRVMSGVAGMADTANVIPGLQADEEGGEGGGGGGSGGVVVRRSSWRRSTSPRGRFSMQALHADVGFVGSGGGGGGRGGGEYDTERVTRPLAQSLDCIAARQWPTICARQWQNERLRVRREPRGRLLVLRPPLFQRDFARAQG